MVLNCKYELTILFHSYQNLLPTTKKLKPLVKSYNYDTHDAPLVSYGGIDVDVVITSDIRNEIHIIVLYILHLHN